MLCLPGFRPVYMANKHGLARGMLECGSMLAPPDRRKRRRTVMSPLKLAPTVIALMLALAVEAAAQGPAPKSPPASGPASPAPLQQGDAFGEPVTLPERTIVYLK